MAAPGGKSGLRVPRPQWLLWQLSDRLRQHRQQSTLTPSSALGRHGEDLAHRFLEKSGLTVICRNYRIKGGNAEIDIVAREDKLLVFVEVKSRRSVDFGAPDRAIDLHKQKNIFRAARSYALRAGVNWTEVRFDVVSVVFSVPLSIVHQRDAFFRGRAL